MSVTRPPSAGFEPGRPPGPMTLSMTLPAEAGDDPRVARLVACGVLDRDGLAALIHLAHVGLRRGYRDLVMDLHGLTDFPSALFAELSKLSDVAGRSSCRLRLDGLDAAVAAAVDVAIDLGRRGGDDPSGSA
jgi:hypothetical protein